MAQKPRSMTKTDLAFQELRSAIEDGRLKPGERLTIARLRAGLDMSPTPIREALRLLQAEGLLEHEPHRGVVVRTYRPDEAKEVYRLRILLEPLATELAVDRATEAEIEEMRDLHQTLMAAADPGPTQTDAAELNARWHRSIYDASRSPYLIEFIARLWQALPVRAIWLSRRAPRSVAQHVEIMSAIEARDAAAAAELMREHVTFGAASTVEHLRAIEAQR